MPKKNSAGWVYVMTNRSMPGICKVGFTTRSPDRRAGDLNQTGVPHPYVVDYETMVAAPYELEQQVHARLAEIREGKEWFRCTVAEAIAAIASAADEIARMGKQSESASPESNTSTSGRPMAPSTPPKTKCLTVDTPQGYAGKLRKESRFAFEYDGADKPREISLTMPLRQEGYASTALLPLFAMNRPEGMRIRLLERRFAKLGGLDDMGLLRLTGHTQIGRLSLSDPLRPKPTYQTVGLSEILTSRSQELFDWLIATNPDSGISGVQPKALALTGHRNETPDLIVKPSGTEYPHVAQNEFLCMDAARRAGISCPDFWLSDDGGLFVVDRFDLQNGGVRLGFEDACVLMGRMPDGKYESSYEMLAKVVQDYCHEESRDESLHRLFEYVALSVMTRNGDAHLKNFGLLYEHPASSSPRLAPLYDVVTTSVYGMGTHPVTGATKFDRTLALKLAKSREYPEREALEHFGKEHCRVSQPRHVCERIAAGMEESLKENEARIEARIFALMRKEWESGIWHALNSSGSPRPAKMAGPQY